ncbi:MAG: DUF4118 domain-containing protein [Acidobacteria bacterium]|nr:DUF4118 domain-containing protein [Acidobacteriota bacterium]
MSSIKQNLFGYLVALSGIVLIVASFKLFITNVNHTTTALILLLIVQISASIGGFGPSLVASILGMLCFNFFFLPPVGYLTIDDPQNWVALSAFLVTAIITSKLSSAAHSRAQDAERRKEEVWKLYELGRNIIATPDFETAVSSIARQVVDVFAVKYCAVYALTESINLSQLSIASSCGLEIPSETTLTIIHKVFKTGELKLVAVDKLSTEALNSSIEEITFAPLKVGLRPTGVIALTADKLERGAIEAIAGLVALALERAKFLQEVSNTEALRQSDKLKSSILASVSHNLRTPLTAIRTSIDSLLRDDFALDKAALREFHLIISEEAYRLTRIVDNLLDMARIEAGELSPKKLWSSPSELISTAIDRCASVLREHQIIVDIDENTPSVKIDSPLLTEALTNLLENAAKYSPAKSKVKITGKVESEKLTISVEDEGQGISSEELERIFDKFYRGKSQATKRTSGTGMGLAIAKGIIEAHQGKIWAESTLGKGAIFKFSIPVECKDISEFIMVEEYE